MEVVIFLYLPLITFFILLFTVCNWSTLAEPPAVKSEQMNPIIDSVLATADRIYWKLDKFNQK